MEDTSFVGEGYGNLVVLVSSPDDAPNPQGSLSIIEVNEELIPSTLKEQIQDQPDGFGGVLQFKTESRAAVVALLRHLYLGDYLATEELQDRPISLLLHVQVYKLAVTYGIDMLARQAHAYTMRETELACSTPPMVLDLCDAIRFLYLELPDAEFLFDIITNYVVGCYIYHGLGKDEAFLQTVYEAPDFHQRLLATSLARGFDADGAIDIINTPVCGHRVHEHDDPLVRNGARFMCALHDNAPARGLAGQRVTSVAQSDSGAHARVAGKKPLLAPFSMISVWREPSMSDFRFFPDNSSSEQASEALARQLQDEEDRLAEEDDILRTNTWRNTFGQQTQPSSSSQPPPPQPQPEHWPRQSDLNGVRAAMDFENTWFDHSQNGNTGNEGGQTRYDDEDSDDEMQRTPRGMYAQSTTNLLDQNWPLIDDSPVYGHHPADHGPGPAFMEGTTATVEQPRTLSVTNFSTEEYEEVVYRGRQQPAQQSHQDLKFDVDESETPMWDAYEESAGAEPLNAQQEDAERSSHSPPPSYEEASKSPARQEPTRQEPAKPEPSSSAGETSPSTADLLHTLTLARRARNEVRRVEREHAKAKTEQHRKSGPRSFVSTSAGVSMGEERRVDGDTMTDMSRTGSASSTRHLNSNDGSTSSGSGTSGAGPQPDQSLASKAPTAHSPTVHSASGTESPTLYSVSDGSRTPETLDGFEMLSATSETASRGVMSVAGSVEHTDDEDEGLFDMEDVQQVPMRDIPHESETDDDAEWTVVRR